MGPGQGGGGSGSGGHLREKKFCFYVHFLRPLHMDTFDRRPSLFFLFFLFLLIFFHISPTLMTYFKKGKD